MNEPADRIRANIKLLHKYQLFLPHYKTKKETASALNIFRLFILSELEILLVQTPLGSFAVPRVATNRGRQQLLPCLCLFVSHSLSFFFCLFQLF